MQPRFRRCAWLVVVFTACAAACSRTGLLSERTTQEDATGAQASLDAGADPGVDARADAGLESNACRTTPIALTRAVPAVVFVLDRSPSMGTRMEASSPRTRWEALRHALESTLPSVDDSVAVGALLFPASASSCSVSPSVDLSPTLNNVDALVGLLYANSPRGATPTFSAIQSASSALLNVRASGGSRALVLATDGSPDCNADLDPATCRCVADQSPCPRATQCLDDVRTLRLMRDLAGSGLPTYVVGIQSSGDERFTDVLNAMAVAGGRALQNQPKAYYVASTEPDLEDALAAIRDQVRSCTYLTADVPKGSAKLEVRWRGELVLDSAWSWQDITNGELVLDSELCAGVETDSDLELLQTDCNNE